MEYRSLSSHPHGILKSFFSSTRNTKVFLLIHMEYRSLSSHPHGIPKSFFSSTWNTEVFLLIHMEYRSLSCDIRVRRNDYFFAKRYFCGLKAICQTRFQLTMRQPRTKNIFLPTTSKSH